MNILLLSAFGPRQLPTLPPELVVTHVADLPAAERALEGRRFEVALVPVELLQPDGQGLVSSLRALDARMAVVLVAAESPASLRMLALRAGVDDVLALGPSPSEREVATTLARAVATRHRHFLRSARGRSALVVDGDPAVADAVAEALGRADWLVFTASDPYQALEVLAASAPEILLTDLLMPGLTGCELITAALRYNPAVVPIVMTGDASLPRALESLRAGAFDFLIKPLTAEYIVAVAERAYTQFVVGSRGRRHLGAGAAMQRTALRVLLVEDDESDELIVRGELERVSPGRFDVTTARSLAQALARLGPERTLQRERTVAEPDDFDVILLDLTLPDSRGLATFAHIHMRAPELPVVVLTGTQETSVADQVLVAGAQEFLTKGAASGEVIAMRLAYAIDRKRLVDQLSSLAQDVRATDTSRRRLLELNVDGLLVVDQADRVLFANPAAAAMLGAPHADLVGTCMDPLLVRDGEHQLPADPSGAAQWLSVTSVATDWGRQRARLVSLRDITERKNADAQRERIAHNDRLIAIGQLAAGVAHEVNNPATFVLGNLGLLAEGVQQLEVGCEQLRRHAREKGDPALQAILEGARPEMILQDASTMVKDSIAGIQRIAKTVKDLSAFSRLEQGEIEAIELTALIDSACSLVGNEMRHRARLVKDFEPVPSFAGDRVKLGQVIVNLLMNATQAIDAGAAEQNEIRIATRHEDGEIHIAVSDTGSGIPREHLPRIFEPFFTTKAARRGTGLGLSISQEIVHRHGGTIKAESSGKGARFEIVLPEHSGFEPKRSEPARSPAPTTGARARILVIDDEEMLRRVLKATLRDHDVVLAEDGAAALAIVRGDQAFDVILCDLMMPNVDGPAFFDTLSVEFPRLVDRVVFVTGGAFTARAREFLARVPSRVLEKPLAFDMLRGVVAEMAARVRAAGGGLPTRVSAP